MADFVGRIGIEDLDAELQELLRRIIDGEIGGGDGGNVGGNRLYISPTEPSNMPIGSYWIKIEGTPSDELGDKLMILSAHQPQDLKEGDVWLELTDKSKDITVVVIGGGLSI